MLYRIAITPGEPAGIGPDLCIQIAQQGFGGVELVIIADPDLLKQRAEILGLPLEILPFDSQSPTSETPPGCLTVLPVPLNNPCCVGKLDKGNSKYVLQTLELAVDYCQRGLFDAMVTGPVHKGIINEAGIAFSGHTEYLARLCDQKLTVMMLATDDMRVALATTHMPLKDIAGAITRSLLSNIITILHHDLEEKFGVKDPTILVCGLNPHAGEGGYLGREEIDIITPVLDEKRQQGLDLIGPLPADTLFTEKILSTGDAVLAMYHDQGLPVLKYKGFGRATNITLGLPIIRTSVDHGTALELAGSARAEPGSLMYSITAATDMIKNSQKKPG